MGKEEKEKQPIPWEAKDPELPAVNCEKRTVDSGQLPTAKRLSS